MHGLNPALRIAFSSGSVMGITVVGIGLLGVTILYMIFQDITVVAGFGFGASSIALFARVGGGIFTKAADVGSDLVGKVEAGIPEDDPRNPGVIADNVGDNVGDVAGMGADLFESYVSSIIAAIALATAGTAGAAVAWDADKAVLPLMLAGAGIVAAILGTFVVRANEQADFGQLFLQLPYVVYSTVRRGVPAVHEGMNKNFCKTIFHRHPHQGQQMIKMTVDAAVRNQAQQMQTVVFGRQLLHGGDKDVIFFKFAGFHGPVDPGKILVHDASRADIQMANLGISHLSFRQTHGPVMGGQGGTGIFFSPFVHIRRFGHENRVVFGFRANAPAIKNCQQQRFQPAHWIIPPLWVP